MLNVFLSAPPWPCVGALCLLGGLSACRPALEAPSSRPPARFRSCLRTLREQVRGWNAGQIERFLAGYRRSPYTVFASKRRTNVGFEKMARAYRQRYDTRSKMGQLRFGRLGFSALSSDELVVRGRWQLRKTRARAGQGWFVLIMRRGSGVCRVALDYTSADPR